MLITFTHCLQNLSKKIASGSIFLYFRIHGKHFERCFDSSEPLYKWTPKSRMTIVKFIHFVSQHKVGGLRFNMWL